MNKFVPLDPVSGPLSKDELRALVDAPFGQATKIIRRHDPLYGRAPGEKIRWKVRLEGHMQGTAYVEAATEKEASDLADKITESSLIAAYGSYVAANSPGKVDLSQFTDQLSGALDGNALYEIEAAADRVREDLLEAVS